MFVSVHSYFHIQIAAASAPSCFSPCSLHSCCLPIPLQKDSAMPPREKKLNAKKKKVRLSAALKARIKKASNNKIRSCKRSVRYHAILD